jgi:hypothetical protein
VGEKFREEKREWAQRHRLEKQAREDPPFAKFAKDGPPSRSGGDCNWSGEG